ncbi:hypothetical protein DDE05_57630, partial [Streptomyces cavourensis]
METGEHAATLTAGEPGILHGSRSYVLQDDEGQITEPYSISAGLDYPGIGPEHSYLKDIGRGEYRAVTDDAETLRATIEDQLIRADILVTTGGVSVGAYDVVKEALSSVGDEDEPGSGIEFRKLAMQPGKPQGFGSIGPDHTPLLALPGNPVSSYVSFELFVRPAIRALMGLTDDLHRPTVRA